MRYRRSFIREFSFCLLMTSALAIAAGMLPAAAQIQSQGVLVGAPHGAPVDAPKKPTPAACLAKGKAQGLKGTKLRLFVRDCLK